MKTTVYFSSFRTESNIKAFRLAADYLSRNPDTELIIEPGEYLLSDELSKAAQSNVMHGVYGSNPQKIMFNPDYKYSIGFPLHGIENCSVIAENVKLVIDGFMEPVSIKNCRNINISGFEIAHKRKPFSRGTVRKISSDRCLVEFDSDCPVSEKTPMLLRHYFCRADSDIKILKDISDFRFIDDFHIELLSDDLDGIEENMHFYTVHTYHSRPAILIESSENIVLDDTIIRNQPGMGIVGNRSENVVIRNLKVIPEDGYKLSTNTDATHFTSMKGLLRLENCVADGQGDDFTNIHAYYQIVAEKLGERKYKIKENTPDGTHSQSIDYPDIGDILELSDYFTLDALGEYRITDVELIPEEHCCAVTLEKPLPECTEGLVLADITRLPEVEITGCTCRNHHARGILIKCRKATLINNEFYNILGPAIEIAAEAWWYEGVTPAHCVIGNNRISDCGTDWGEASGIVVKTDCEKPDFKTISDIIIENNSVNCSESEHGIYCRNVDGLRISGNGIISSSDPIKTENCILK